MRREEKTESMPSADVLNHLISSNVLRPIDIVRAYFDVPEGDEVAAADVTIGGDGMVVVTVRYLTDEEH